MSESNGYVDLGDLAPKSMKIKLGGKEYELREATAAAAHSYRQAVTAGGTLEKDNTIKLSGTGEDAEAILIAGSLFNPGTETPALQLGLIKTLPERIKTRLFDMCKELNPVMFKGTELPNP